MKLKYSMCLKILPTNSFREVARMDNLPEKDDTTTASSISLMEFFIEWRYFFNACSYIFNLAVLRQNLFCEDT